MAEKSVETLEIAKIFIGYHGTSRENADSIIKSNFKPSENPDDWLGHGIYFFVNGISDPKNNATEYACNKAWDNKNKILKYKFYSLLSVNATGTNVLNTNDMEHLKAFNEVSLLLQKKHKEIWVKGRDLTHDKRIMWNLVADFMSLEVIIHNLYIQTKEQRKQKITLNVPNTTVMCVKDNKNIDFDTIKLIGNGVVK